MIELKVKNSDWSIGGAQPGLFLGLNVLEDAALAMETATELKKICQALKIPYVFKASFDKANRSSVKSFRGTGIGDGLKILESIRGKLNLPTITDVHEPNQCEAVAAAVDIVQIPAFLCRQTDLVVAAVEAVKRTGGLLHVKKGQFLAPWDCKNILDKINSIYAERPITILCERGVSFGYNNLIVDMLGIPEMRKLGAPVSIDATHAVQLPGAGLGNAGNGSATGGRRFGVEILATSALMAGADGVFLEFHPDPEKAKCDGPSCLPLSEAGRILKKIIAAHQLAKE